MSKTNIILTPDSYKFSMYNQYPEGTKYVFSYIESRGGDWDSTVFLGVQAFIREYLLAPITQEDINEAEELILLHGEPFYREGWEYILKAYDGYLPVSIMSADEGSIIPTKNILVAIRNEDPRCFWLTTVLETALLRAIWYPTTVATNSFESKKIIKQYLEETGDVTGLPFKLHDFGARGASSQESAMLGGMAHLVNFMGTDTIAGILGARRYYDANVCGFSIPAMEHSTVTSWGRENEVDAYRNMLKNYGKPNALLACVSDSYNIYDACIKWGTELKQEVIDSGACVVIRPDSGIPNKVVLACIQILGHYFGFTINNKGYKVLNYVRVIQGDGIDQNSIRLILQTLKEEGWSADNVAFGQGGALLQQINRDTMKFAMKCSAIYTDKDGWIDVYKDPIDDKGKTSKKGLLMLHKDENGYRTETDNPNEKLSKTAALKLRYFNGKVFNETTFDEIRERAAI